MATARRFAPRTSDRLLLGTLLVLGWALLLFLLVQLAMAAL
jgi:hypothetical protein